LLVLSRKKNESIVIGGLESGLPEIRVTVGDVVGGHKVQLRIDAPREVPIVRNELLARSEEPGARNQTESGDIAVASGKARLA
jgi:carbon storage regulator CsrA